MFRCIAFLIFSFNLFSQNITINSFGQAGYINTPSAFTLKESSISLNLYSGRPDSKLIVTGSPFNRFDASIFYASISGIEYGSGFDQSYKDKGFNFKFNIKDSGDFPAIALGANDIGGTGLYSSEYIVLSERFRKFEYSVGLGWGHYNDGITFKNPFISIDNRFSSRGEGYSNSGGSLEPGRYFSGEKTAIFGGFSYDISKKSKLLIEYDPSLNIESPKSIKPKTNINVSVDYFFKDFFIKAAFERGVKASIQIGNYQNYSNFSRNKAYKTVKNPKSLNDLKAILELNKIGLKEIYKNGEQLGLKVRQNAYHNQFKANKFILQAVKEIQEGSKDLVITHEALDMEVLKTYHSLTNIENIRNETYSNETDGELIYKMNEKFPIVNNNINPRLRTFLASREGFIFQGLFLENDLEIILRDNLIFLANLKYSLIDNFDELYIPPIDTYPNQVRSDIKKYLNNMNNNIPVGRMEINYYKSMGRKNFLVLSAGLYEEMFGGYGAEYLYYPEGSLYGFGAEFFSLKKRDYKMNFEFLDYQNNILRASAFIKDPFSKIIFKISAGEYLAGDKGYTFEAKRRFDNGIEFSAFFSKTNVSSELYGEGSFDKGIRLKIPFSLFGESLSLGNYEWRPLTKDPAALLIRSSSIEDIIERYRIN